MPPCISSRGAVILFSLPRARAIPFRRAGIDSPTQDALRQKGLSSSIPMRTAIQLILGVIVIALIYFLFRTITDPWKEHEAKERTTELTRTRMDHARTALIRYRDNNNNYPSTLDSLVMFVKSDSALSSMDLNDVFPGAGGGSFNADSLPFSPRDPYSAFEYELYEDDTTGVVVYYLKDPDSADHIGAQVPDPAFRNAASWE